jgi:hypothetical protein
LQLERAATQNKVQLWENTRLDCDWSKKERSEEGTKVVEVEFLQGVEGALED